MPAQKTMVLTRGGHRYPIPALLPLIPPAASGSRRYGLPAAARTGMRA